MTKKIRLDIVLFLIVATVIFTAVATAFIINNKLSDVTQVQSAYSKLKYIDDLVDQRYIGSIDSEKLSDEIAKGYVNGMLDNYAEYFTAKEYKAYTERISGDYDGIGIYTVWHEGGFVIYHVSADSPAEKAGLKQGEKIIAVDDKFFTELTEAQASKLMNLELGKTYNLTMEGQGEENDVRTVVSMEFKQKTVSSKIMGYVGYIYISSFNDRTPENFSKAVEDLIALGAKNLIIDVRFNPGGAIESVVSTVDRLVGTGTVATAVYKKTDNENVNKLVYDAVTSQELDMPIVVLCNKATASGGELFTASLVDFGKATSVGNTTFGKGTGQSFYKLADGSYIKFSDFTYFPPSGSSFNLVGFTPDEIVETKEKDELELFTGPYAKDDYLLQAFEVLGVDSGILSTIEK